jgi:GAF domain-containing protein/CheY-like chemotaxis protein
MKEPTLTVQDTARDTHRGEEVAREVERQEPPPTWEQSQKEISRIVLQVIYGFGTLACLFGAVVAVVSGDWALAAAYGVGAAVLSAVFLLSPRMSPLLRGIAGIGLFYGIGVWQFLSGGTAGYGTLIMVMAPTVALLLQGQVAGLVMWGVCALTQVVFAALYTSGMLTAAAGLYPDDQLLSWALVIGVYVGLSGVLLAPSRYVVATLVNQLIGAVGDARERWREVRELSRDLERTVEERTADLARRTRYLEATAGVARDAAAALDVHELLARTVNLVRERFGFYHTGVFLLDEAREYAVLRAASSEAGQRMLLRGHKLRVGEVGIVGDVAASGRPRIALDVGADAMYFDNPDLPETRSEMALPLKTEERVIGVMDVQSTEPEAFTEEDVAVLQTLADQVVLAIEKARLLGESERAVRELEVAYGEHARAAWETLEALPAYAYDRVEVTPTGPEPHPAVEKALGAGEVVAFAERGDGRSALVAPMRLRDQVIGAIALEETDEARSWTEDEMQLVAAVGEQVALALESARLFEEARTRSRRLALLNRIATAASGTLHLDQLVETVYNEVAAIFEADAFSLLLYDEQAEELDARFLVDRGEVFPQQRWPLGSTLASVIIAEKKPLLIRDFRQEGRQEVAQQRFGTMKEPLSWLGVPLRVADRVVGVVSVQSYRANAYGEDEQVLLSTIADQIAVAIENARLFEEARIRAEELAVLNELAQALTARLSMEAVLEEARRGAARLLDATNFFVALYDPEKDEVVFAIEVSEMATDRFERMPAGQGLTGYIIGHRTSVLIEEDMDERLADMGIELVGEPAASWLGVPLLVGDEVLGVMGVQSYDTPRVYGERERDLLTAIASQAAIALQNARLFEEASRRAEEMTVLNELAQALATRLGVDEVLAEAYRGASRLLDATNFFIGLYDPVKDVITFPLTVFNGEAARPYNTLEASRGLSGYVIRNRTPVLIREDVPQRVMEMGVEQILLSSEDGPPLCWLGVPLLMGDQVLGLMAVRSYTAPRVYDERDQALLTAVASQTAIALQNARLFEEARVRADELAVLNELAGALTARLNVDEVLEESYRGASRLLDTTNFYLALYDSERNEVNFALDVREGEVSRPVSTRRLSKGLTEYIIRTRKPVLVEDNLPERLAQMGVELIGEPAASWLGVPLLIGDQVLGVMALQSYTTPRAYDEHDRDLLVAVASQTAIALQNARLFGQTQVALTETETLYRASRRLASAGDLNEILASLVEEARIPAVNRAVLWALEYDAAGEPETFVLSANWYSGEGTPPAIPVGARFRLAEFPATRLVVSADPLFFDDVQGDERIDPVTGAVFKQQNIRALALLPLWAGARQLGTLMLISDDAHHFTDQEIRPFVSLVRQMAVAVENLRLLEETGRRATQLATAAAVARDATAILDVNQLLDETVHLISERFGFYHAGVFLIDPRGEYAVLRAASSEGGRQMLEREHRLKVGEVGIVGHVAKTRQPRIAFDVGEDAVFFNNPDLPETRSEMALPLIARGRVIGVLDVQSTQHSAFSDEDVAVLRTMADQLATAIENARLFSETEQALVETRELFEASRAIGGGTSPARVRQALVDYVAGAGLDMARVLLYEFEGERASHIVMAESWSADGRPSHPGGTRLPLSEFGLGRFMHPTEVVTVEDIYADPRVDEATRVAVEVSRLRSFAVIPLTVGQRQIGGLLVGRDVPYAYPEKLVRNLWTLCGQAAIAVENLRLLEETRRRAEELEAINEVGRTITSVLDLGVLLRQIVDITKARFGHDFVSIMLVEEGKLQFVDGSTIGESEVRLPPRSVVFDLQQPGIVTDAARTGRPVLANDVLSDPRFTTVPELSATRSELAVPIGAKGRVIGVLDVQSSRPLAFDQTDVLLLQSLASQASVAIENARLFEETETEALRRALISEVLQAASTSLDPEDLLHQAGEAVSRRLKVPSVTFLWEPGSEVLRAVAAHEIGGADIPLPEETRVTGEMDPTLFEVATARRTRVVEAASGRVSDLVAGLAERLRFRSSVIVPLVSRGRLLGLLQLGRVEGQPLSDAQLADSAEAVAVNLSVGLENARLYQDAVETAERLAEVDRLKSQFLANMSHELRTPLNSIIGFSRVILKGIDGELTDLQRQDLEAIYNSGQHLLGLINDILDISKIEAGKMELAFEPVDMTEIIRGVMATAIALVKDKAIELQQSVPSDLPAVIGDSRRIRQVLLNLVSNASKFTDKGYIRVEAWVEGEFVTVSVADSGIGIPADRVARVFEAFTQVDASPSRRYGGTGLGLAISRSFVELHGGRMWVESEVGKGSTFFFAVPVQGPPPPVGRPEARAEQGPEPEAESQGRTGRLVLCVDDDEGVVTLFRRYLHKQGYQVAGLADSTRVVEETKRLRPFAITLDVMMPGKDGWQVIKELKADPETRDVPVIMCTIVGEKGQGLSLGASDYLVKPILEQDLVAALDRLDREAGRHRVLVVDDQQEDRKLLRRMIESQEGYEVVEAASGREAIDLVSQVRPHIIVLDLLMPEVDGFTVLEAVKTNEATRFIPIIVVTAKELTDEDHRLLNHRIEALIRKGVLNQEELLEDVAAALRKLGRRPPQD